MHIQLMRTDTGCIVPEHLKLNQDGYFRATISTTGKGRGRHVMFHRYVYEHVFGIIPAGFDAHHTCHNRACCNIKHLVLVPKSSHVSAHNHKRYLSRFQKAFNYYTKVKCSGAQLSMIFHVSSSTACRWIRLWKV